MERPWPAGNRVGVGAAWVAWTAQATWRGRLGKAAGGVVAAASRRVVWSGALVALAAALLAWMFHANAPQPFIPYHDTFEYVHRADIILAGGSWIDPIRLPGYPLLLALVFAIAGRDNLNAAEVAQSLLFVVTAVEVYALAYRVWRRTALALLVGLIFALNIYFFAFFRALLSDGLGAALVVGLALAVVIFLERPGAGRFWVVAALCYATLMTRGEWLLLPLALFPFLLLAARRRGMARRLLAPMLGALALIYGAVGVYMALNWRINGYFGLTDAMNINLYGKITQYGMQAQAPAHFLGITAVTEAFARHGLTDPWSIYWRDHALAGHNFALMGAYARAIILSHPIEFLAHSAPLAFISLTNAYVFGGYSSTGLLGGTLAEVQAFSQIVFPLFMLFPLCAAIWLIATARRWLRRPAWMRLGGAGVRGSDERAPMRTEALAALSLLALYALAVTTLTTYAEYARLHLAFDPLMLIVVIGSLAALMSRERRRPRRAQAVPGSLRAPGPRRRADTAWPRRVA